MTELDDRIVHLLSDGKSRGASEIGDELFGAYVVQERKNLIIRLRILRQRGDIKMHKAGNYRIYTISDGAFDLLEEYPDDALVGTDFDTGLNYKDAILQILADGKYHTTRQIERAYYHRVPYRGSASSPYAAINKACNYLQKWGQVERLELVRGLIAWRRVA